MGGGGGGATHSPDGSNRTLAVSAYEGEVLQFARKNTAGKMNHFSEPPCSEKGPESRCVSVGIFTGA